MKPQGIVTQWNSTDYPPVQCFIFVFARGTVGGYTPRGSWYWYTTTDDTMSCVTIQIEPKQVIQDNRIIG